MTFFTYTCKIDVKTVCNLLFINFLVLVDLISCMLFVFNEQASREAGEQPSLLLLTGQ